MTLFHRPACVRHTLTYRWPCALELEFVCVYVCFLWCVISSINSEANGPIFEALSFTHIPSECEEMPCIIVCVLEHHHFSNQ